LTLIYLMAHHLMRETLAPEEIKTAVLPSESALFIYLSLPAVQLCRIRELLMIICQRATFVPKDGFGACSGTKISIRISV